MLLKKKTAILQPATKALRRAGTHSLRSASTGPTKTKRDHTMHQRISFSVLFRAATLVSLSIDCPISPSLNVSWLPI